MPSTYRCFGCWSGACPDARTAMILLNTSNQNGAPSERASAVNSKPNTFAAFSCERNDPLCQPSGRPSRSRSAILVPTRVASNCRLESDAATVSLTAVSGCAIAAGSSRRWAKTCACAIIACRSAASVESLLAIATVSALANAAMRTPRARVIHCACRLYQPETRSIAWSNHSSMLFCNCSMLPLELAINSRSVCRRLSFRSFRTSALKLRNDNLRQTLLLLIANSNGSMEQLQKSIEEWFDQAMDRVSGWYKRQAQWITLALGVLIAAFANADTVAIANRLSTDAALRQAIIAQAQVFAQRRLEPAAIAHPDTAVRDTVAASDSSLQLLATRVGTKIADLERLGLPLGWQSGSLRSQLNAAKVFGLLLTARALSLGAPFLFDVLNKIIAVRASGQAPGQHPKQR